MRVLISFFGASLLCFFQLGAAHADSVEFSVGRVEVLFAQGAWQEAVLPDDGMRFGGEVSGVIDAETRLFVAKESDGRVSALVWVRANANGMRRGYMRYTPSCDVNEGHFAEGNDGFNARFAQCLKVFPAYPSSTLLKELLPGAADALRQAGVHLPSEMFGAISRHSVATGTFLDVRVLFTSPDDRRSQVAGSALPAGVRPQHVNWGRQLKEAVRSSVYSVSGKFEFPPLDFKATETSLSSPLGR